MSEQILVVGTYDTKEDELTYLASVIRSQGGQTLTMDVSILGAHGPRQTGASIR